MKVQGLGIVSLGAAFALVLVACGADADRLVNPPPNSSGDNTADDPATETPETGNDEPDLSDADQLTSEEPAANACDACPTSPSGPSCCTTAEDVSAVRAASEDACGVDMSAFNFPGCTQLDQPGTLDAACPDVQFPGFEPMPGCCTESGHCGAMESFVGFGCTKNPDPNTWIPCGS